VTVTAGGKSERFKDRPEKIRRSKDGAQKGTDKKDPEDTDDEAEKKASKGTNKLSYNRADVLEYCKDLENLLRTQRAKEYNGASRTVANQHSRL
jgi:hypothetical protein